MFVKIKSAKPPDLKDEINCNKFLKDLVSRSLSF